MLEQKNAHTRSVLNVFFTRINITILRSMLVHMNVLVQKLNTVQYLKFFSRIVMFTIFIFHSHEINIFFLILHFFKRIYHFLNGSESP